MSFTSTLVNLLKSWGEYTYRRRLDKLEKKYPRTPGEYGYFKGNMLDDNFRWVDTVPKLYKPHWLNVTNIEDDYIITLSSQPRPNAIRHFKCTDTKDVEIATKMFNRIYSRLGNVIISIEDNPTRETISQRSD